MTKRSANNSSETSEAIIAENAEHEGTPRTTSAARAQESWEEFKERSNKAAEAVLEEVTNPDSLKIRARQSARQAKAIYRSYKPYVIAAGVLVLAGVAYAAFKPAPKRSWFHL